LVVTKVRVAPPLAMATGEPSATLSTRSWTLPVGVVVTPEVAEATDAVTVTVPPLLMLVAVAEAVVLEASRVLVVTPVGVARSQSLTMLFTSTEPQPLARS
jgi:hypothetical protein